MTVTTRAPAVYLQKTGSSEGHGCSNMPGFSISPKISNLVAKATEIKGIEKFKTVQEVATAKRLKFKNRLKIPHSKLVNKKVMRKVMSTFLKIHWFSRWLNLS